MADSQAKSRDEAARLLADVLVSKPAEALERLDFEDMSLGRFVKNYAGLPDPVDLDSRSSVREDAVVRELARLLAEDAGAVRVIDACCGLASLPRRIISAIGVQVARIEYVAIERDAACVDMMRTFEEDFKAFGSFRSLLRDVCDLTGVEFPPAHLVVLNNVLHEIPPRHFPQMFASLNGLLCPDRGRICVIDMESLPLDSPEAIAIPWTASEVVDLLKAAGFNPESTTHEKSVRVYQVHFRRAENIDKSAMRAALQAHISRKLDTAIRARRRIEALLGSGSDHFREWVVTTGTVARLADELAAIQ